MYTATHEQSRRTYVIKRHVSKEAAPREMRVMRAYGDAPNLVRLHRFFVRGGMGYIVMPRVPGKTLREFITGRGRLTPEQTTAIAVKILTGLRALHKAGFVHGDIHTGNVIVSGGARPKTTIIDFQYAVRKDGSGRAKALRFRARPPRYAPESGGRLIEDRYDIYGVGYMCACMLKGTELKVSPHDLSAIDDGVNLWSVIRRATAPDPARRFPSAVAMRAALRSIVRR